MGVALVTTALSDIAIIRAPLAAGALLAFAVDPACEVDAPELSVVPVPVVDAVPAVDEVVPAAAEEADDVDVEAATAPPLE